MTSTTVSTLNSSALLNLALVLALKFLDLLPGSICESFKLGQDCLITLAYLLDKSAKESIKND